VADGRVGALKLGGQVLGKGVKVVKVTMLTMEMMKKRVLILSNAENKTRPRAESLKSSPWTKSLLSLILFSFALMHAD
jgi:hypothetical protein